MSASQPKAPSEASYEGRNELEECLDNDGRSVASTVCVTKRHKTPRFGHFAFCWPFLLSFLAHGPKRACGDVYSLLCALHAVCAELFPPCRRTGPTGPARTSSFVFCACVERDRDQERDSDVSIFCLYGSVHSCLVHKPSSGILSNKTLSRPRSLRCRKGTPGLHRRLIGPATTSGARIVERAHPFRSRA